MSFWLKNCPTDFHPLEPIGAVEADAWNRTDGFRRLEDAPDAGSQS